MHSDQHRPKAPTIRLGIVGVGKIVNDQHLPALRGSRDFVVTATASPYSGIEGIARYSSATQMLAQAELDAVAVCTPPQPRYEVARAALAAGKHVLLEKPPCLTTAELASLAELARRQQCTLYQTWHSRHAPAVAAARAWLEERRMRSIRIEWKEDVRRWHPGQTWIWQPGGLGVFDPGINALSILTELLPESCHVRSAQLSFPSNCHTPIAAELALGTDSGVEIQASFDFLQTGPQTWDIVVNTQSGAVLKLSQGGARMEIDGAVTMQAAESEYAGIYERFAGLIAGGRSEVDARPFQLVADAFLIGSRRVVAPFHDEPTGVAAELAGAVPVQMIER